MKKRFLGKSGLEVSAVGLGCMGMSHAYGQPAAQISLAWMLAKKPWIVPIQGTRKPDRLIENSSAVKIVLTETELQTIDNALSEMKLSAVYGGQNNRR